MTTLPDQIAREVLEGHAAAYFALPPSLHEARGRVVARAAYIVSRHLDKLQERLAGAEQRAKDAEVQFKAAEATIDSLNRVIRRMEAMPPARKVGGG